MSGPIRILEDGTRIYSNYTRYKPVPKEQRKRDKHKPDDPRAVRFHDQWFLPLDLLPDDLRLQPETRPDTDAYDHMGLGRPCACSVCLRPEAQPWQDKWWRERGVRFVQPRRR
jgi:hypothetical protein